MRFDATAVGLIVASSLTLGLGSTAVAKTSRQSVSCARSASKEGLTGAQRTTFNKKCMNGPLAAETPTAPTAQSKGAQAVTKPSGVDRTTRTKQCAAEADRKGLTDQNRKAYQLSCLATAGPVSGGETGTVEPHPANQIKGIGTNNYKPSDTTAKSTPKP